MMRVLFVAVFVVILMVVGWRCQRLAQCGQKPITGKGQVVAYKNSLVCVRDRPNQQRIARQNGIDACSTFCASLGATCAPQPAPNPQATTHSCEANQEHGEVRTQARTAPFDCICKRPN
jgi:hypothetical protein